MTHRLDHRLKAAHERDLADAPRQHRLRTPQCPAEHVLLLYAPEQWPPAVRAHVDAGCRYCNLLLSLKAKAAAEPVLAEAEPLILSIRLSKPGLLAAQWRTAIDANIIGLPRLPLSGIRLYERVIYLSPP